MGAKVDIGRTYQSQTRVEEWMTAEKAGNKGVDVLSTPMLLQLIEDAAVHRAGVDVIVNRAVRRRARLIERPQNPEEPAVFVAAASRKVVS